MTTRGSASMVTTSIARTVLKSRSPPCAPEPLRSRCRQIPPQETRRPKLSQLLRDNTAVPTRPCGLLLPRRLVALPARTSHARQVESLRSDPCAPDPTRPRHVAGPLAHSSRCPHRVPSPAQRLRGSNAAHLEPPACSEAEPRSRQPSHPTAFATPVSTNRSRAKASQPPVAAWAR